MKSLRITTLGLALAAGLFSAGSASAAVICSGCAHIIGAAATNLGAHDPTVLTPQGDESTFTHTSIALGSFSDWWIFQINPAGDTAISAIFTRSTAVDDFKVELYSTTAPVCLAPSSFTTGGACSSLGTLGPLIVSNSPGGNSVNIDSAILNAGFYAFNISGIGLASTAARQYSGNLNTATVVPEPGSLALVALALIGAGASLRRKNA